MGKSKELSFEPSRKLSFLTGLLQGIGELKDEREAQETAAAKQQNALLPHLLRQMQFQQTETREAEEFRSDINLRLRKEGREREEFQQTFQFKLKEFDYQKESDKLQREFQIGITNLEQQGRLTQDNINHMFTLKMQEMANKAAEIRQNDQQLFLSQQQDDRQAFEERQRVKSGGFTTAEREASQSFKEIENQLDRDLQRDLRGKVFEDAEQVVLTNYQNAAQEYKDVINLLANPVNLENEFLNKQAVVAADEMARWGEQLIPVYESKGLAPPLIPPTIQPFEDRGKGIFNLERDQPFGFLPRLEVPTDVETVDKPIEAVETKASQKVSAVEKELTTSGDEFNQYVQSLQAQMKQQKKKSIKLDDRSRKILLEKGFDTDAIERAASGR